MIGEFSALKGLFKIEKIKTDNAVFRLHYKVTVLFLVTGAVIVSLNQYVGDPIDCFVTDNEKAVVGGKMLDNFCWIHSTHTLPNQPATADMPIPGLGTPKQGQELKYHKYYQWVAFFLMFQAITFYIPRFIWKFWENKKMEALVEDLCSSVVPHDVEIAEREKLANYLYDNLNRNQFYAWVFFACELLNAVNIVGEIFFVDTFLGGEFTEYGGNVLQQVALDPENRTDPMSYVFPKVSKCLFNMYGPSGTIQKLDAYCVLPVNIFNEKFFLFLWFWYIILAVITGLGLIYRIVTLLIPRIRKYLLYYKGGRLQGDFERHLAVVFNRCNIGDWFVLTLVGENINQWTFASLIQDLYSQIQGKTA